jgi:hypothetical protein
MLREEVRSRNMSFAVHEVTEQSPATPELQDAVRAQMDRMLRSTHFRNSRRYPTLLRYIVEETLEGRASQLKERLLGIEVFGRIPDYDTAADPIVRVTVAEIRKRIAQYYHEDAHASELRIELKPGSYIPEFLPAHIAEEPLALVAEALIPAMHDEPVAAASTVKPWLAGKRTWLPFVAAVLLVCGAVAGWRWLHPSPLEQLWAPVFETKGPITFCLPMSVRRSADGKVRTLDKAPANVVNLAGNPLPPTGSFLDHELIGENVVYSDVLAMTSLEKIVEPEHRPVRVRLNFGTNLNELREGPTIFIGGLDNQWTLKLIAPLRYRFAGREDDVYYIQDTKNPQNKDLSIRLYDKYTAVTHDYAIIARVHSEELGQPVIIAAGIGMSGTAAAGEFLSDSARVAELRKRLGPALRDHDFEAVLRTDVVNGLAGPAQIVAVDIR